MFNMQESKFFGTPKENEEELKIGDKVIISHSFNRYDVGVIKGLTKSGNFKVETCINYPKTEETNSRYNNIYYKHNGFMRGGGDYNTSWIRPFTEELYDKHLGLTNKAAFISKYNWYSKVNKEGGKEFIEKIYNLIKEDEEK